MSEGAQHRRSDYPVRALGVVAASALLHFAGAALLLLLLHREEVAGQRVVLSLTILVTALAAVTTLYVRAQYSSAQHAARSIPWAFWITPPVAMGTILPLVLPRPLIEGPVSALVGATVPLVACTWSTAILVGLVADRVLRSHATRTATYDASLLPGGFEQPMLGQSFARVMVGVGTAASMLAIAVATPRPEAAVPPLLPLVAAALSLAVLLILAAATGASLGQSPGEDIVSIGQRLDTLGYGSTHDTLASPVVVTSRDEVGGLLANLEALRGHLVREMQLYQQALDRTKAADALKSDFLSAVSHELRTPLNAVGGFAQLLLEGVSSTPLTEAQAEDVRLIQAGGRQLLGLINDILDMSMIESGELRLSYSLTDVAEVIEEVVRIHQPLVRAQDVDLHAEIGPDVPKIVCDRRRLTQILTNLVSNAVKFTEQGSITVRAAFDPRMDGVVIRCIDTGVGIEPQDLSHIFEEYRQAGSVKRRKKGTGLGLAIARRIAQSHGGSLSVESTPGEGSTFVLSLPRDPPTQPLSIDIAGEAARTAAAQRSEGPRG